MNSIRYLYKVQHDNNIDIELCYKLWYDAIIVCFVFILAVSCKYLMYIQDKNKFSIKNCTEMGGGGGRVYRNDYYLALEKYRELNKDDIVSLLWQSFNAPTCDGLQGSTHRADQGVSVIQGALSIEVII